MTETDHSDVLSCVCGGAATFEKETSYSGGGRYKGAERFECWEVSCDTCKLRTTTARETEPGKKTTAVAAWNCRVRKAREKQEAPDKLVYALSQYARGRDDQSRQALARLLTEVRQIREHLKIERT